MSETFLDHLVVKNTILTDTYLRQVNTVNFLYKNSDGNNIYGSLTFARRTQSIPIDEHNVTNTNSANSY
jgi:hypothetical protein